MPVLKQKRMAVPVSRAMVCDILRYDRIVPSFAHDRICNVSALVEARRAASTRISWPTIFLKAYAITAAKFPRLQQTWMTWPWPHLYQHSEQVGTLVVRRKFEEDEWLFWAHLRDLDTRSLAAIQGDVDLYQHEPVEMVYRRQLWLARQPALIRRFCWWLTFQVSGNKKCKRLGTFFLSTISGRGAEIQNPPSILTSGFTYGPVDEDGNTRVTITYDHRLLDGHHVADILAALDSTLNGEILRELKNGVANENRTTLVA